MSERPYHNVFVSYRGPSSRGRADGADPQLEDNATKALVNVLELAPGSAELTQSFLRTLGVDSATGGPPAFFLQGGPPRVEAPHRYLLGLSVSGDPSSPAAGAGANDGAGRTDAAIYLPGELLVALEVKVGTGELVHAQLARHARRWGVASESDWRTATWAEVYRWAEREREREGKDPLTAFLLEQLLEFLRAADLTPFLGFQERDFLFFAGAPAERDWRARQQVRVRLTSCWEAIERELGSELAARVGKAVVQPIKPHEHAAAAVTPPNSRGVNLTVELWEREVQVNLVGWNDPQVATLLAWLHKDEAEQWLHAHGDFELVLFRRFPTAFAADGTPVWRSQGEQELPEHIPAAQFTRHLLDALLGTVPPGDRPGVHLRIAWKQEGAIARGAAIARDIAEHVKVLQPLVEQINNRIPKRPARSTR